MKTGKKKPHVATQKALALKLTDWAWASKTQRLDDDPLYPSLLRNEDVMAAPNDLASFCRKVIPTFTELFAEPWIQVIIR